MFGTPSDPVPPPSHVAMFRNILPDALWMRESHHAWVTWEEGRIARDRATLPYDATDRKKAVPVGLTSTVYGHMINEYGPIPDPKRQRLYGWNREPGGALILSFNRSQSAAFYMGPFASPWRYREWMECALIAGWAGCGRVGGDYFRMGGRTFFLRYPASVGDAWNKSVADATADFLAPGPDGAVTTVRLENARAGIQESEARIFLEKALLNKGKPLSADLAKRCQDLLDARTTAMRMANIHMTWERAIRGDTPFGSYGWQDSNRRLFDLAAEVAKVSPPPGG
jgi:hypothetical protein